MNIPQLKSTTAGRISGSARRLALLHSGVALGASFVLTVINFLLSKPLAQTGGLSGIGTRVILTSVQSIMALLLTVAMPFWDLGFVHGTVRLAKEEPAGAKDLLEGFRRLGPALRLMLLRALFVGALAFFCIQAVSTVYLFSPFSGGLMEQMEAILTEEMLASGDMSNLEALLPSLYPVYIISGMVLIALLIPLFYRFRLADTAIMDGAPGALAALRHSAKAMKGNAFSFFKLDLSFWWYYLLLALSVALAYGDVALEWLKVPVNETVAYFGFYALSIIGQLLLAWRCAATVHTTYAAAYLELSREIQ